MRFDLPDRIFAASAGFYPALAMEGLELRILLPQPPASIAGITTLSQPCDPSDLALPSPGFLNSWKPRMATPNRGFCFREKRSLTSLLRTDQVMATFIYVCVF